MQAIGPNQAVCLQALADTNRGEIFKEFSIKFTDEFAQNGAQNSNVPRAKFKVTSPRDVMGAERRAGDETMRAQNGGFFLGLGRRWFNGNTDTTSVFNLLFKPQLYNIVPHG